MVCFNLYNDGFYLVCNSEKLNTKGKKNSYNVDVEKKQMYAYCMTTYKNSLKKKKRSNPSVLLLLYRYIDIDFI